MKKTKKEIGLLGEKRATKKNKGALVRGSGNKWNNPGDVEIKFDFEGYRGALLQVKSTSKKSYSLKLEDLIKAGNDAIMKNMLPAMSIQFIEKDLGYVVLPEWVLVKLVEGVNSGRISKKSCT